MKRSYWIIIIVLVVAIGALLLRNKNMLKTAATTPSPSASSSPSSNQTAAVISYGSNGFSPAMTTVKSGDSVTFSNKSGEDIQVDSNPHPTHTDDTDLNVGQIGPGQSKTVILTKKGSFGFHNHLDPSEQAKITIQ